MSLALFPGFSLNVLRDYNLDCVYETWTKTTARFVARRNIGARASSQAFAFNDAAEIS